MNHHHSTDKRTSHSMSKTIRKKGHLLFSLDQIDSEKSFYMKRKINLLIFHKKNAKIFLQFTIVWPFLLVSLTLNSLGLIWTYEKKRERQKEERIGLKKKRKVRGGSITVQWKKSNDIELDDC